SPTRRMGMSGRPIRPSSQRAETRNSATTKTQNALRHDGAKWRQNNHRNFWLKYLIQLIDVGSKQPFPEKVVGSEVVLFPDRSLSAIRWPPLWRPFCTVPRAGCRAGGA